MPDVGERHVPLRMRMACAFGTAIALCGLVAAPAGAEQAVALTSGNTLLRFNTTTPGTIDATLPVTGLGPNQTLRGIDVRPATGELYGSSATTGSANNSIIFTYRIDPSTGMATFVGSLAMGLAGAADIDTGYDFSPVRDWIKYANSAGSDENANILPDTGAIAQNNADLTPASTTDLIAAAYDRNSPGGEATTLFAIDADANTLAMVGGPNGVPSAGNGVVTDLATLGVPLNAAHDAGFDISSSGVAYAALSNIGTAITGLYTIDISETNSAGVNVATLVGAIGNGSTEIYSLAILRPDTDNDGFRDDVDNCAGVANPDQADLDGDGQGDPCDPDQDGDGLADATENAIGSDPRSINSDGDGLGDAQDACPAAAAATANGCPAFVVPPDTTITKSPKSTKSTRARIEFSSTLAGSIFECRLDRGGFKPCSSPKRYRRLRSGKHTFRVRAISPGGVVDLTAATAGWRVLRGRN